MTGFEPGAGWREVDPESVGRHDLHLTDPETGRVVRAWVRVPPVPPLPTAPWTVIRGTMPSGGLLTCILNESGQWWDSHGIAWRDPSGYVDGFEVLAEPRAVTAEVIADWFAREAEFGSDDWRNRASSTIRREFGVDA